MGEFETETAVQPGDLVQYLDALGDNLGADAVTGDDGDFVGGHTAKPPCWGVFALIVAGRARRHNTRMGRVWTSDVPRAYPAFVAAGGGCANQIANSAAHFFQILLFHYSLLLITFQKSTVEFSEE